MAVNFDDQSTGISYQNFPKDPEAREQIAIVKKNVEELKNTTVSRQIVTNLENKFKQNELDNVNYRNQVGETVKTIEEKVDGLDGGNTEKIANLEAAVNEKANKDLVDSLLNQIEGSVKQINGATPDEAGNVIIDFETQNLVSKPEFSEKTDLLSLQLMDKIDRVEIDEVNAYLFQTNLQIDNAKGSYLTLKEKLDNMVLSGGGGGATGVLVAAESEFSGTTNVTKTYTSPKDGFAIINDGLTVLSFTINGLTYTLNPEESWEGGFLPFTSVSIQTTGPYRAYSMVLSTNGGGTVIPEPDTTIPIVTITPNGSNFTTNQTVTLTANEPATIYYTTNGDTPTVNSTVYNGAFNITTSQSVMAIARDTAGNTSLPVTATFTKTATDSTAPTVTANPPAGPYTTIQTVTLTANEPAEVFYTLDGSTPTITSAKYTAPLVFESSRTLKFIGRDTAGNISAVVTAAYVITTTPTTGNVLLHDTFNRADSATLGTPEIGPAWTSYTGPNGTYILGVQNNEAVWKGGTYTSGVALQRRFSYVSIPTNAYILEAKLKTAASGGKVINLGLRTPGVSDNMVYLSKSATINAAASTYTLYKYLSGGNATPLKTGTIYGTAEDTVKVEHYADGLIKVFVNGVLDITHTDTDLLTSPLKVGFGLDMTGCSVDEIKITAM